MARAALRSLMEFSLMSGGPIERAMKRIGLGPTGRRAVVLALFCWLPFVVLAGRVEGAFSLHVRFLIALPVLVLMQRKVDRRITLAMDHFLNSGLLASDEQRSRAIDILERASRFRHARGPEFILLGLVVAGAVVGLSAAPVVWVRAVALPIFQIVVGRWVVRIGLWSWVLWRLSRLQIQIIPTHPDGKGGLDFLNWAQAPFASLPFALTCVLVASHWVALGPAGGSLPALAETLGTFLVPVIALILAPLLFFMPRLTLTKGPRVLKYARFSETLVKDFDRKWVSGSLPGSPLTQEVSAVTDMIPAYGQAQRMKVILPDRRSLVQFVVTSVLPAVPLVLAQVPRDSLIEIAKKILI